MKFAASALSSARSCTNVRFRWEYGPGSDVFLGYSDGRDPLERGVPTLLLNRSLTLKLTRLFRC